MSYFRSTAFKREKRGFNSFNVRNRGEVATVERDLFEAIYKTDLIVEEKKGSAWKIDWQRSSRTDSGVSAEGQLVSFHGKLEEGKEEEIRNKLNESLPPNIRIWKVTKMTKSFNARKHCGGRVYNYLLPTHLFSTLFPEGKLDRSLLVEKLNKLLSFYVGTHKFHNFTEEKNSRDASAKRFIKSFSCECPLLLEGMEFIPLRVEGQSFLLHQIRRMVGFVVAVLFFKMEDQMGKIFAGLKSAHRIATPTAPSYPLLLVSCLYQDYLSQWKDKQLSLSLENLQQEVTQFRNQTILTSMAKKEKDFKM